MTHRDIQIYLALILVAYLLLRPVHQDQSEQLIKDQHDSIQRQQQVIDSISKLKAQNKIIYREKIDSIPLLSPSTLDSILRSALPH